MGDFKKEQEDGSCSLKTWDCHLGKELPQNEVSLTHFSFPLGNFFLLGITWYVSLQSLNLTITLPLLSMQWHACKSLSSTFMTDSNYFPSNVLCCTKCIFFQFDKGLSTNNFRQNLLSKPPSHFPQPPLFLTDNIKMDRIPTKIKWLNTNLYQIH